MTRKQHLWFVIYTVVAVGAVLATAVFVVLRKWIEAVCFAAVVRQAVHDRRAVVKSR